MLRDLDQRQQATSQLPMGESYENKQATEVIKGLPRGSTASFNFSRLKN